MVEEELAQRREEITFPLEGRVYKDSGRDGRGLCTCKVEEWGLGRRDEELGEGLWPAGPTAARSSLCSLHRALFSGHPEGPPSYG